VISNTETGLREPMRVGPGNGHDLAPVEIAIRRALEEPLPAQRGLQRCRF